MERARERKFLILCVSGAQISSWPVNRKENFPPNAKADCHL